jgi:hypothetical protein
MTRNQTKAASVELPNLSFGSRLGLAGPYFGPNSSNFNSISGEKHAKRQLKETVCQ